MSAAKKTSIAKKAGAAKKKPVAKKKSKAKKTTAAPKINQNRTAKLLDAHVKYELARFGKIGIQKTITNEVTAAFEWMQKVRLKDIFSPDDMVGLIRRIVVEPPIAGGITEIAGEASRMVIASQHNKDTILEDIFPRRQFEDFADKIASMDAVRKALIRRTVRNPAYARLVAEAIYTLSKEFVLQNNPVVRKVPVLSSLIKLGKGAVNMAVPGLEPSIDNQIKDNIEKHIESVISDSEEFLLGFLDEERVAGISAETWNYISQISLADHFANINADDMEDFVIIIYEFWLNFRGTRYFKEIYTEIVHYFFEKYGDRELDLFLEDFGVSAESVIRETIKLTAPIVDVIIKTGFLEKRLRAHLEPFYNSKAALSLMDS